MTSRFKSEPFFFSIHDLKYIFLRKKKLYVQITACAVIFIFFIFGFAPPMYRSEAQFKKAKSSRDGLSDVKTLLTDLPGLNSQSSGLSYLTSRLLLESVIADIGLQAKVQKQGLFFSLYRHLKINILAEVLDVVPLQEDFVFRNLQYSGDTQLLFDLQFLNEKEFILSDSRGKDSIRGSLGSFITLNQVGFVLEKSPATVLVDKKYKLTISPIHKVLKKVKKNFFCREDKVDKEVLFLTFSWPCPILSESFLNQLMHNYIAYRKEEGYKVSQDQASLVGQRRRKLVQEYEDFLETHASYLEKNLGQDGFMGSRQQMIFIDKPHEVYHSKLYEVDLELKRVRDSAVLKEPLNHRANLKDKKRILEKKGVDKDIDPYDFSPTLDQKIVQYLTMESIEKDSARQALITLYGQSLPDNPKVLDGVENQLKKVLSYLSASPQGPDDLKEIFHHEEQQPMFLIQIQREQGVCREAPAPLNMRMQIELDRKKQHVTELLTALLYRLQTKKSSLLLKSDHTSQITNHHSPMHAEAVQRIFIEYAREIDTTRLNIQQLTYLMDQIFDPSVEISSLGHLLPDSVSQKIIQEASRIGLELADQANISLKESDRIKERQFHQKQVLFQHIKQLIDVEKIREKSLREQIDALRYETVDRLTNEKKMIENKIADLRNKMSVSLPEKWKAENLHLLTKESYLDSLGMLAKVEEAKVIEQYMQMADYKVVDPAFIPKKPEAGRLFMWPGIIGLLCLSVIYVKDLLNRAKHGSPISFPLLRYYDLLNMGRISSNGDLSLDQIHSEDLDAIRKIAHFSSLHKDPLEGVSIALLGHSKSNYSCNLAEILSRRGSSVLLIDASFRSINGADSIGGLFDYMQGLVARPLIIPKGFYDFIHCGGYCRTFVEMLSQNKIQEFIFEQKKKYDFVLIYSGAKILSVEAMTYQSLSDLCILGVGFDDSIEDCQSFFDWQEGKKRESVAFLLSD